MPISDRRTWVAPAFPAGGDDNQQGYIMVALLIAMAVSAIWMGAALPTWRQQVVRDKEAELIFRGEQYARAIYLYRQKNNQASPPNIDILVSQRYLRKKYKDPITNKDFLPLGGAGAAGGGGVAGISGVRSTSNDTSLIIYKNQQSYSQFPFDWIAEAQRAGAGAVIAPGGARQGAPGAGGVGPGTTPGAGGARGGGARGGTAPGTTGPGGRGIVGPGPGAGAGRSTGPGRGGD